MGFIWALIVGGVIGAIAGAITKKGSSMALLQYHCRVSWFNNWSSHLGTWDKLSWDGYCAIDMGQ
uniref:GlsB protein n=1 Tax=Enterococcus faecalis TaxID=1351 RepID=O32594_ENTFL|nr:glsB [Enterococcus faecalis]